MQTFLEMKGNDAVWECGIRPSLTADWKLFQPLYNLSVICDLIPEIIEEITKLFRVQDLYVL